jgi:hypothetical protein
MILGDDSIEFSHQIMQTPRTTDAHEPGFSGSKTIFLVPFAALRPISIAAQTSSINRFITLSREMKGEEISARYD